MATNINLDMVMRPAEVALANMDEVLDRTADNVGQAGYLPAGMREGLVVVVAAAKANVDGAKLMNQEVTGYAKANIDANLSAAKATMTAKLLNDAMTVQRDHLNAVMNDGLREGGKIAELALATSEKATSPLRAQMEGPWAAWFKTAA